MGGKRIIACEVMKEELLNITVVVKKVTGYKSKSL